MDTVCSDVSLDGMPQPKRIALAATIIRADGTIEELGTVAEYHRDPKAQAQAIEQGYGRITLCA